MWKKTNVDAAQSFLEIILIFCKQILKNFFSLPKEEDDSFEILIINKIKH